MDRPEYTPEQARRLAHGIETLGEDVAHRAVEGGILKPDWRERLAREKSDGSAEPTGREKLRALNAVVAADRAEARLDALVADLRGLVDEWVNGPGLALEWNVPIGETFGKSVRAVLDKHAGEQPPPSPMDSVEADLRGLADEWVRDAGGNVSAEADEVRAVLDKHAGEQGGEGRG